MLMIERLETGRTDASVASAQGIGGKTVRKWRDRFRAEGAAGLGHRSSRPYSSPSWLDRTAEAGIEVLRRQRLTRPAIARPYRAESRFMFAAGSCNCGPAAERSRQDCGLARMGCGGFSATVLPHGEQPEAVENDEHRAAFVADHGEGQR